MILLGKSGLLKDIYLCLKISDLGNGLPFHWSNFISSTNQLEVKHKKDLHNLGFRLRIGVAYMITEVFQAWNVLNGASLMTITHFIMYHITGYLILSCGFLNLINHVGVVQLFNGFIQIEKNLKKYLKTREIIRGENTKSDSLIRRIIYFLTFTGSFYAFIYAGDIIRNPCFPAYAGYWMNTQCIDGKPGYYLEPTWSLEEVGKKLALSMGSYFLWAPLTAGWLYLISLERFDRKIAISVPCLIGVQTACLNNTFSFISGKDLGSPIWYNLMYVWCEGLFSVMVVFGFGIFADVCNVSMKVQRNVKGAPELRKNKWFRRWILSCPTLKIYFGGSNFVDRLTPLTIQDFTINQTVSLMLLKH